MFGRRLMVLGIEIAHIFIAFIDDLVKGRLSTMLRPASSRAALNGLKISGSSPSWCMKIFSPHSAVSPAVGFSHLVTPNDLRSCLPVRYGAVFPGQSGPVFVGFLPEVVCKRDSPPSASRAPLGLYRLPCTSACLPLADDSH